jgi:hypothetical protein
MVHPRNEHHPHRTEAGMFLIFLYLCSGIFCIFIYVDSYYDDEEAKFQVEKWKGKEDGYVDSVRLCGSLSAYEVNKACIVFRIKVRFFFFEYYICSYFCIIPLLVYKDRKM